MESEIARRWVVAKGHICLPPHCVFTPSIALISTAWHRAERGKNTQFALNNTQDLKPNKPKEALYVLLLPNKAAYVVYMLN